MSKTHWGNRVITKLKAQMKARKKNSPGQISLWNDGCGDTEAIHDVAEKFVLANCFDPKFAALQFPPPP